MMPMIVKLRMLAPLLFLCAGVGLGCDHTAQEGLGFQTGGRVYFPADAVSALEHNWYGGQLYAMDEPVLGGADRGAGYLAMRMLYLPTWGHPVSVRYEAERGRGEWRAVKLDGAGGYEPGGVAVERSGELSAAEVAGRLSELDAAGFAELGPANDLAGFTDGSTLVVEVVREGEHRVLTLWSPAVGAQDRGLDDLVAFYSDVFSAVGVWNDTDDSWMDR